MSPLSTILLSLPIAALLGTGVTAMNSLGQVPPSVEVRPVDAVELRRKATTIPTIITNLAEPPGVLIRLDTAAIATEPLKEAEFLVAQLRGDFVILLNASAQAMLQGSAGIQALGDDLSEIARDRSGGAISRIAITSMIVQ